MTITIDPAMVGLLARALIVVSIMAVLALMFIGVEIYLTARLSAIQIELARIRPTWIQGGEADIRCDTCKQIIVGRLFESSTTAEAMCEACATEPGGEA